MKIFLLINVKMPTIVGILTFMSGKNSILGLSEPKKSRFSGYLYLCAFKISCSIELSMKNVLYPRGQLLLLNVVFLTHYGLLEIIYRDNFSGFQNFYKYTESSKKDPKCVHDAEIMSHRRRCDVVTLHRCQNDVMCLLRSLNYFPFPSADLDLDFRQSEILESHK